MAVYCHRIQFYDHSPLPFTCLTKSSNLIAAARNDGSVEIYDETRNFFMIARISPSVLKSVEALGWIGYRLFASGALGSVHELDIMKSDSKDSVLLTGAAVSRCLITSGNYVIVGNDEGHISLFGTSPKLSILHTFQQLSGRILALAGSTTKHVIAASTSVGILAVYKYTQHASEVVHMLSFESEKTSVWSLHFSNDDTLFAGDNTGHVNVWDTTIGSLLYSFACHTGHVLALTKSIDAKAVYSGGSDGLVRKIHFTLMDGQSRWELGGTLHGCRRDIRGMAFISGMHYDPGSVSNCSDSRFEPHRLLAVGQDARLQILACEQPEAGLDGLARAHKTLACQVGRQTAAHRQAKAGGTPHVAALPFWPPACTASRPPPIHFATCSRQTDGGTKLWDRFCLLHYSDHLTLVRLSVPDKQNANALCDLAPMLEGACKLADIRPRKGMDIIASAISDCGRFVAYSDDERSRVLELRISMEGEYLLPAVHIRRLNWDHAKQVGQKSMKRRRIDTLTHDSPISHTHSTHTSSSETDTDTDELSSSAIAKFFCLNQPPAGTAGQFDSRHSNSFLMNEGKPPTKPTASPSGSPSSHLLGFTGDSTRLLLVTRLTNELVCLDLQYGTEHWRVHLDSDNHHPFRALHLSFSKHKTPIGYVAAVGCSDGRVRLYSVVLGIHLFTFGCPPSTSGHAPLPVTSCFSRDGENISILYTNGQLTQWHIRFTEKGPNHHHNDGLTHSVEANLDAWLSAFWKHNQRDVCRYLGVFHSMCHYNKDTWLLASDRYLVLLKKNEPYYPNMIRDLVDGRKTLKKKKCLKINKMFESTIQASILMKNEIAVVSLCESALSYKLSAPLKKKQFGT